MLGRRGFLISAAAMAAAGPVFAQAPMRLAAIDWAMLETAVAVGHGPVAACELIGYRAEASVPETPGMADLGLRGAPNYELLQLIRPDLILTSPLYVQHEARLRSVAPVLSLSVYVPGEPPFDKAMRALADLAAATGSPDAGARAQADAVAGLEALSQRLAPFADRPVSLIDIGDARHLRAFGFDSMFGDVLGRVGLRNAWTDKTEFSFRAPLPLERLAQMPDARIVICGDIPVEARDGLRRSILWQALPAVREGRVHVLPTVNAFGGVPSALRFGTLLAEAFEAGPISI